MPANAKIDAGIRPLVDAMNATGWIETVSSCQGHSKGEFRLPFVSFYCRQDKIRELSEILDTASEMLKEESAPFSVECNLVFETDIGNNTVNAVDGWVVFEITVKEYDYKMDEEDKEFFITVLTQAFKNAP